LPSEIGTLCLVDRNKEISPLIKCKLNPEINKYENKTCFFEPFDKFEPVWINNFELSKMKISCLESVNGIVRLSLTSKGNKSLVSTFRSADKDIDCVLCFIIQSK